MLDRALVGMRTCCGTNPRCFLPKKQCGPLEGSLAKQRSQAGCTKISKRDSMFEEQPLVRKSQGIFYVPTHNRRFPEGRPEASSSASSCLSQTRASSPCSDSAAPTKEKSSMPLGLRRMLTRGSLMTEAMETLLLWASTLRRSYRSSGNRSWILFTGYIIYGLRECLTSLTKV